MTPNERREGLIPATRWTLVERAGDGRLQIRRMALGELLRLYWPVLQAHLRRRGQVVPDRVDDLLQGFVCDKIVEQELLRRCRRGAGKFRSFLLTALDRHLVDQYRRQNAAIRAPERAATGNETRLGCEPAAGGNASAEFDAAWARQTIADAVRRTREECADSGRTDVWEVLHGRLLAPALDQAEVVPYDVLVQRLGLQGTVQAANLLTTGKRMFQRKLREVVSLYSADEANTDEEIQEIQRILAGATH